MAYRVRSYRYPMSYENFFLTEDLPTESDKWKNHLNENEIASWISDFSGDDSQEKYEDFMIKEHVVALRKNTIANDYKADWIEKLKYCLSLLHVRVRHFPRHPCPNIFHIN
jgi:hypothetical protein